MLEALLAAVLAAPVADAGEDVQAAGPTRSEYRVMDGSGNATERVVTVRVDKAP